MTETYSTQDIWLGSLFLTESDAQLTQVQTGVTGHSTVTFSFRGKGLSRLADMYHKQEALANVVQIREKLNLLRDILFQQKEDRLASHA
ncbi:MAG: hypothetical protein AB1798_12300 [Spirochaetota bacterium]